MLLLGRRHATIYEGIEYIADKHDKYILLVMYTLKYR